MDPRYNLSFIVQQSVDLGTPIIAASIQYRLSFWGWMFSNELSAVGAGNLGLRDQRMALHWTQENIGAFGGDPSQVTLWGESAGAFSVGYQLVAYGGRDDNIFHRAILQSGAPSAKFPSASDWQPYFDALVQEVSCNGASDVLSCLRALPVETLNAVFNSTVITVPQAPFFAALDNDFMTDQGSAALWTGKFLKVPTLMGINTDEGTSFALEGINTTDQFLAYVKLQGASDDTANTVATLYPDDPDVGIPATMVGRPAAYPWGLQWKRASAFYGDLLLHTGRRFMAQAWSNQSVAAYTYRFNVLVHGALPQIGATHFEEVPFVFHNTISNGYGLPNGQPKPFLNVPDSFQTLADIMSGMVSNHPNLFMFWFTYEWTLRFLSKRLSKLPNNS
jgi:acetylcholinesterase